MQPAETGQRKQTGPLLYWGPYNGHASWVCVRWAGIDKMDPPCSSRCWSCWTRGDQGQGGASMVWAHQPRLPLHGLRSYPSSRRLTHVRVGWGGGDGGSLTRVEETPFPCGWGGLRGVGRARQWGHDLITLSAQTVRFTPERSSIGTGGRSYNGTQHTHQTPQTCRPPPETAYNGQKQGFTLSEPFSATPLPPIFRGQWRQLHVAVECRCLKFPGDSWRLLESPAGCSRLLKIGCCTRRCRRQCVVLLLIEFASPPPSHPHTTKSVLKGMNTKRKPKNEAMEGTGPGQITSCEAFVSQTVNTACGPPSSPWTASGQQEGAMSSTSWP